MVQQIVNIPEKDMHLFLMLAKKMKWKVEKMKNETDHFELSPEQIAILDERSKAPRSEFISAEESLRRLDEL